MTTKPVTHKQILVVEDEPEVIQLMELSLRSLRSESLALTLHPAADGQAALDWMRENVPDLVVLDVMMPKLSGVGVYERMLADERLKDVPVLVVSVIYSDETLIRSSALARLPSLRKPFSPVMFAERIKSMLGLGQ